MREADVQRVIFDYIVVQMKGLAIRVNSGARTIPAKGRQKRRFFTFASWRVIGYALSRAGVSDILACIGGQFWAIEVKAPGNLHNVSEHQARFLAAVERAGGVALVVDSLDGFEKHVAIEEYKGGD